MWLEVLPLADTGHREWFYRMNGNFVCMVVSILAFCSLRLEGKLLKVGLTKHSIRRMI